MNCNRTITTGLLALLLATGLHAQEAATQHEDGRQPAPVARSYTKEHPLVYEDAWDLWPYTFLNDKGEPDGFNIDIIRLLMKELDIPYVIKLKPANTAFHDLKNGQSDLMLGVAAGFHDEFGQYSKNAITLFTQSVATPKGKPVEIKNFKDLGRHQVIVNDSSLCHHLMLDYGWGANAKPVEDMREAIQQVSATESEQIVWNTLSLEWLLRKYHIENLELSPVNMPHGEYKFMSNDTELLDRLDEVYAQLYSAERLTPIQNKWFYPERQTPGIPRWVLLLTAGALLLMLIASIYGISYRVQARRLTKDNSKRNKRLALILETSQVRIWTYDIRQNQFTWHNENGQAAYTYSQEEFATRYSAEDFVRIMEALGQLAANKPDKNGEEKEVTLNVKAKDLEGGDTEMHDFVIALSVLSRDKNGTATVIIGTKKDVTEEQERQRLSDERTMRYWAIFNTTMAGILLFDKDGVLVNINDKACQLFDCDAQAIIDERVRLADLLDTGHLELADTDGFYATQIVNLDAIPDEARKVRSIRRRGRLLNEFRLITVYDDSQELLGVFAVCLDISEQVSDLALISQKEARLRELQAIQAEYDANIDGVLHESDVRLASYSPKSHTLTIHRSVNEIQHALTQTRCMTLVDDQSKKLAMRTLNDMDEKVNRPISVSIRTVLRARGGRKLNVSFSLMPLLNKQGEVTEYLGLSRDFSELRANEELIKKELAKVQEVESTKNNFVKNMVQEIKTPMATVVSHVGQMSPEAPTPGEPALIQGILTNADYLLHLIDNILYLSRLEAHMVEINKQPRDFAETFESHCMSGWAKFQNSQTRYLVENPYEQLVIDIDSENLGHAIEQVTANAAQHTTSGSIRARYDYIGRRLIISIDDTGSGIPKDELARINAPAGNASNSTKGLGLAICKELLRQMGGTLEVNSEVGSGTTVYITIPCHASVIRRKKIG